MRKSLAREESFYDDFSKDSSVLNVKVFFLYFFSVWCLKKSFSSSFSRWRHSKRYQKWAFIEMSYKKILKMKRIRKLFWMHGKSFASIQRWIKIFFLFQTARATTFLLVWCTFLSFLGNLIAMLWKVSFFLLSGSAWGIF